MTLGELITALEAADPNQVVRHGFTNPHSYRGYYEDLAFEPADNVTVREMLKDARSALGTTYEGWKGGDFTMRDYTDCWLSEEGHASGDTISSLLLELMLSQSADRAAILREAAGVAENFLARFPDMEDIKAEGIIGPHTMAAAIAAELRIKADQTPSSSRTANETPDPDVVAYRDPNQPSILLCRQHGQNCAGLLPLTPDDLPDGGICTYGRLGSLGSLECGKDVLIAQQPTQEA